MTRSRCDVAIIGAGIAGSVAALKLSDLRHDLSILVITKGALGDCASALAQGGIALPRVDVAGDLEQHVMDTLRAGNGYCDKTAVQQIIGDAPLLIDYLEKIGVEFDRTEDDQYRYALEGGHRIARVIHVEDATGSTIMSALHRLLTHRSMVTVNEGVRLINVESTNGNEWNLTLELVDTEECFEVTAQNVILAMGGSGQVFLHSSNPQYAVGDAISIALKLFLPVRDLQWMQFHPTVVATTDHVASMPLVTEALRGIGAHLVNEDGERFMIHEDPRGDLAPRDVVSAAMLKQMQLYGTDHVYLNCRHLSIETLRNDFPGFLNTCDRLGLDPMVDCIPVRPAAHYQCGGIEAHVDGQTRRRGLYAIGECARTGMHGSNRLASNSLLEAGVMALRVAQRIATELCTLTTPKIVEPVRHWSTPTMVSPEAPAVDKLVMLLRAHLQHVALMSTDRKRYVNVVERLLDEIERYAPASQMSSAKRHDLRSLVTYARAYLGSHATTRTRSSVHQNNHKHPS